MADALAGLTRDVFVRYWTSVHEGVYRATGGRLLNATLGMVTVELTTVGRRSGLPRTTMLTSPVQDGSTRRRRHADCRSSCSNPGRPDHAGALPGPAGGAARGG